MTGVVHEADDAYSLSEASVPDHVVSWSDFSLQHKTVRKLTGSVIKIFQAFTGFVILITCWSSVVVEVSRAVSGMF